MLASNGISLQLGRQEGKQGVVPGALSVYSTSPEPTRFTNQETTAQLGR
jgi:hypothetical protein